MSPDCARKQHLWERENTLFDLSERTPDLLFRLNFLLINLLLLIVLLFRSAQLKTLRYSFLIKIEF